MTIHCNLTSLSLRILNKFIIIPGHKIVMSMCNQYLMSLQGNFFIIGKICKKVIISCDNRTWALCQCLNENLSAFHITTVDQIIKGSFSEHCLFQILILSMSIADDQYLHFSSSFMARNAFPLWLILFFSLPESSAEVHPYSGR